MITPISGNVNKFAHPEKLEKLNPGEIATFRITNITRDFENPQKKLMPSLTMIKPLQYVKDPTSEEINFVLIGNVIEEYIDGTYKVKHPEIAGGASKGYKTYNGSYPAQANEFQFMMMCNENGSNPNRDTSKQVKFIFLGKSSVPIMDENNLKTSKLINNPSETEEEEKEYDKLDGMKNAYTYLAEALNLDVLRYDEDRKAFVYSKNSEVIYSVKKELKESDYVDALNELIDKDKEGKKIYVDIQRRVKGKKLSMKRMAGVE